MIESAVLSLPTGAPPFDAARKRYRRYGGAGATALLLHALLVAAFLGSRPGGVLAGGGEPEAEIVEPYIAVSLSGRRGEPPQAQAAPSAQSTDAALLAMMARLQQVRAEVVLPTSPQRNRTSASELFKAVDRARNARAATASGRGERDNGGQDDGDRDQASRTRKQSGPVDRIANPVKSAGGSSLWGVLEPCWKKLPGRSTVPVTLEVALDSRGLISVPPKILRPSNDTPSEARLVAEARALAALGACLPYRGHEGTAGSATIVEFAASD